MTDDEKRELIAGLRTRAKYARLSGEDARLMKMSADALEGTLTEPDAAGVLNAAQSEAERRTAHTLGERPEWVDGYRAGFVDATGWVAGGGH